MKLKHEIICIILILIKYLCFNVVIASTLNSIAVQNHMNQSIVIIHCDTVPIYTIFSLHNPERVVIDLLKISKIYKSIFPINFNGNNLIKCIRTNTSVNYQSTRIVCDLNYESHIKTIMQKKIANNYHIILTISKKTAITSHINTQNTYSVVHQKTCINPDKQIINTQKRIIRDQINKEKDTKKKQSPIIVAIDAGHGGQDPGATGYDGIYEKNITFNIAKKLKKLLDNDSIFKAVMIRDGDYFLSVMDRSELARKKKANILISIHTDSSLNSNAKGASVWVLSNRRAKIETIHWLQRREKHSELLGGLGDILTHYKSDPYFNHLVLDLQFGYAQRVGYNIAMQILYHLKDISVLHKNIPEYSGFGVLRAPDIPSILVETGFISNLQEEYLLTTNEYQEKIAKALYKGLQSYFSLHQRKILNCL